MLHKGCMSKRLAGEKDAADESSPSRAYYSSSASRAASCAALRTP